MVANSSFRAVFVLASGLYAAGGAASAQERSGLLLTDQFGELCTMCEAAVRCEPSVSSEGERSTIYVFHKKTFAGQMATVFDFLPFIGKSGVEQRPVTIFRLAGSSIESERATATLDMTHARIDIGVRRIDRRGGDWLAQSGRTAVGTCRQIDIGDAPNGGNEHE